jgi:hypothetical protein
MNNVEMVSVSSSDINAIGYDPESSELYVDYAKGGMYIYSGVPAVVFEEFLAAPSKGIYCNEQVKKAGFPYRRG